MTKKKKKPAAKQNSRKATSNKRATKPARKPAVKKAKQNSARKPAVKKARQNSARKPAKRNAADYSSDAPIKVTQHFRSGGPGYASKRERAIRMGQMDMFAPGASKEQLLGWLRKNPIVNDVVKQKLGKRFETAPPSLLKKTMKEVVEAALKKAKPAKRNASKRRNSEEAPGVLREAFLGAPSSGKDYNLVAPDGTPAQVDILAQFHSFEYQDEDGNLLVLDYDKLGLTEQMVAATKHPVVLAGKRSGDGVDHLYLINQPSLLSDTVRPGRKGQVTRIRYWARKAHLNDKEPILYWHPLGEETGELPEFVLDNLRFAHFESSFLK